MKTTNKPAPRGHIDLATIREIAALCALKLSEAEACRKLGVNPQTWAKFKCKHRKASDEFAAAIEELRAKKLSAHIENIEAASKGENSHRPDWRASAWMAERVLSVDGRYGDRADPQVSVKVENHMWADIDTAKVIRRVYGRMAERDEQEAVALREQGYTDAQIEEIRYIRQNPRTLRASQSPLRQFALSEPRQLPPAEPARLPAEIEALRPVEPAEGDSTPSGE